MMNSRPELGCNAEEAVQHLGLLDKQRTQSAADVVLRDFIDIGVNHRGRNLDMVKQTLAFVQRRVVPELSQLDTFPCDPRQWKMESHPLGKVENMNLAMRFIQYHMLLQCSSKDTSPELQKLYVHFILFTIQAKSLDLLGKYEDMRSFTLNYSYAFVRINGIEDLVRELFVQVSYLPVSPTRLVCRRLLQLGRLFPALLGCSKSNAMLDIAKHVAGIYGNTDMKHPAAIGTAICVASNTSVVKSATGTVERFADRVLKSFRKVGRKPMIRFLQHLRWYLEEDKDYVQILIACVSYKLKPDEVLRKEMSKCVNSKSVASLKSKKLFWFHLELYEIDDSSSDEEDYMTNDTPPESRPREKLPFDPIPELDEAPKTAEQSLANRVLGSKIICGKDLRAALRSKNLPAKTYKDLLVTLEKYTKKEPDYGMMLCNRACVEYHLASTKIHILKALRKMVGPGNPWNVDVMHMMLRFSCDPHKSVSMTAYNCISAVLNPPKGTRDSPFIAKLLKEVFERTWFIIDVFRLVVRTDPVEHWRVVVGKLVLERKLKLAHSLVAQNHSFITMMSADTMLQDLSAGINVVYTLGLVAIVIENEKITASDTNAFYQHANKYFTTTKDTVFRMAAYKVLKALYIYCPSMINVLNDSYMQFYNEVQMELSKGTKRELPTDVAERLIALTTITLAKKSEVKQGVIEDILQMVTNTEDRDRLTLTWLCTGASNKSVELVGKLDFDQKHDLAQVFLLNGLPLMPAIAEVTFVDHILLGALKRANEFFDCGVKTVYSGSCNAFKVIPMLVRICFLNYPHSTMRALHMLRFLIGDQNDAIHAHLFEKGVLQVRYRSTEGTRNETMRCKGSLAYFPELWSLWKYASGNKSPDKVLESLSKNPAYTKSTRELLLECSLNPRVNPNDFVWLKKNSTV